MCVCTGWAAAGLSAAIAHRYKPNNPMPSVIVAYALLPFGRRVFFSPFPTGRQGNWPFHIGTGQTSWPLVFMAELILYTTRQRTAAAQ